MDINRPSGIQAPVTEAIAYVEFYSPIVYIPPPASWPEWRRLAAKNVHEQDIEKELRQKQDLEKTRAKVSEVVATYNWKLLRYYEDDVTERGRDFHGTFDQMKCIDGLCSALKALKPGRVLLMGGTHFDSDLQRDGCVKAVAATGGEWANVSKLLERSLNSNDPIFELKASPMWFEVNWTSLYSASTFVKQQSGCWFCGASFTTEQYLGTIRHSARLGYACQKCLQRSAEELYSMIDLERFPEFRGVQITMPEHGHFLMAQDWQIERDILNAQANIEADHSPIPTQPHLPGGPPDDGSRGY